MSSLQPGVWAAASVALQRNSSEVLAVNPCVVLSTYRQKQQVRAVNRKGDPCLSNRRDRLQVNLRVSPQVNLRVNLCRPLRVAERRMAARGPEGSRTLKAGRSQKVGSAWFRP